MGPLILSLLLSSPLFTLGTEPFADFESDDTPVDLQAESIRVERSQSTYPAFTAFSQPAANTYQPLVSTYKTSVPVYQPAAPAYQPPAPVYQPSAPVYQSYDTVPTYDATAFEPEAPAQYESEPEVTLPEETSVEVRTAPPTTTTTTAPVPTFEDAFGFNLAERTREEAKKLKDLVLELSKDKDTVTFINELIETNPCVDSLEEFVGLIDRAASIMESAGPDIEEIYQTLNKLRAERNIVPMVRGSADLLLQFETVNPKFQTFTLFTRCSESSEAGFQSMRDLSQILFRMSEVSTPKFTQQIKDNLFQSAIITEAITNFLVRLQKNLAKRDCFTGSDFLKDATLISAQVMDDMAEALGVLGFLPRAKETRQYAAFTRSIAASLGKLSDFKINDDCSPGALGRAAENLNSLATLIEEVGLEKLGVELGLVFRLDLLP